MTNLFSAFDPSSVFGLSINWLSSALIVIFMPTSYFTLKSQSGTFWNKFLNFLYLEFSTTMTIYNKPGSVWFTVSLFLFIFMNNILGLFPYIFTSSSHMSFALSMALPLWFGHILYAWFNQFNSAMAHLVPKNTPVALMSFMVMIELISNLIRPLTLSVRLMANLTAGHLLLTLLSVSLAPHISIVLLISLMAIVVLMVLEVAVSLIQAYVFCLLSTLYLMEVQSKTLLV